MPSTAQQPRTESFYARDSSRCCRCHFYIIRAPAMLDFADARPAPMPRDSRQVAGHHFSALFVRRHALAARATSCRSTQSPPSAAAAAASHRHRCPTSRRRRARFLRHTCYALQISRRRLLRDRPAGRRPRFMPPMPAARPCSIGRLSTPAAYAGTSTAGRYMHRDC